MSISSKLTQASNEARELEYKLERVTMCARFAMAAYCEPYKHNDRTVHQQMMQLGEAVGTSAVERDAAMRPASLDMRLRQQLIQWLTWNDANGIYSDADMRREYNRTLDLHELLELATAQTVE